MVEVHGVVLCGHHVREAISRELSTEGPAVEVSDGPLPVGNEVRRRRHMPIEARSGVLGVQYGRQVGLLECDVGVEAVR